MVTEKKRKIHFAFSLSSFNAKLFLKTRTHKDTSASIQNILKEVLAKL